MRRPVLALLLCAALAGGVLAVGPATGALRVDAEDITGGKSAMLRYDSAGLPADVVQANPALEGYVALRVPRATVRKLPGIASGDVAVGAYSGTRLVDAGLLDTAPVR